jgi:hypothetical protein
VLLALMAMKRSGSHGHYRTTPPVSFESCQPQLSLLMNLVDLKVYMPTPTHLDTLTAPA